MKIPLINLYLDPTKPYSGYYYSCTNESVKYPLLSQEHSTSATTVMSSDYFIPKKVFVNTEGLVYLPVFCKGYGYNDMFGAKSNCISFIKGYSKGEYSKEYICCLPDNIKLWTSSDYQSFDYIDVLSSFFKNCADRYYIYKKETSIVVGQGYLFRENELCCLLTYNRNRKNYVSIKGRFENDVFRLHINKNVLNHTPGKAKMKKFIAELLDTCEQHNILVIHHKNETELIDCVFKINERSVIESPEEINRKGNAFLLNLFPQDLDTDGKHKQDEGE